MWYESAYCEYLKVIGIQFFARTWSVCEVLEQTGAKIESKRGKRKLAKRNVVAYMRLKMKEKQKKIIISNKRPCTKRAKPL